jgi:pimeloyl-ACP methyl ester carboxylesterase
MMREVAEQVTAVRVPRTGHWIAEENPAAVVEAVLDFILLREGSIMTTRR